MGYLNGNTITVDAILTKHGRQKLAEGQALGITKFALSDDGVDYKLKQLNKKYHQIQKTVQIVHIVGFLMIYRF